MISRGGKREQRGLSAEKVGEGHNRQKTQNVPPTLLELSSAALDPSAALIPSLQCTGMAPSLQTLAEQAAKGIEDAAELFKQPAPSSTAESAQPDVARGLAERVKGDAAKSKHHASCSEGQRETQPRAHRERQLAAGCPLQTASRGADASEQLTCPVMHCSWRDGVGRLECQRSRRTPEEPETISRCFVHMPLQPYQRGTLSTQTCSCSTRP